MSEIDELWDEFEDAEPIELESYQKLYAIQGFRTKRGIEVTGLIEIGNEES